MEPPESQPRKLGERRSRWWVLVVIVPVAIFSAVDGFWFGPDWWKSPAWYLTTAAGLVLIWIVGLGLRRAASSIDPRR